MATTEINIPARRAFAELLRQFYSGRITNDQYESRYWQIVRTHGYDSAVNAIFLESWGTYSDFRTHRMSRFWKLLNREQRRVILRWILFLRSDAEFAQSELARSGARWPILLILPFVLLLAATIIGAPVWAPAVFVLLVGSCLIVSATIWMAFLARCVADRLMGRNRPAAPWRDEISPWPFASVPQFNDAVAHPYLLVGSPV